MKPRPRKPRDLTVNGYTIATFTEEGIAVFNGSLAKANNMRRFAAWLLRAADWLDAQAPARKAKTR